MRIGIRLLRPHVANPYPPLLTDEIASLLHVSARLTAPTLVLHFTYI